MAQFKHIHTSGRYTQSAEDLEDSLDLLMEQCDLLTGTEVSDRARFRKVMEEGWGVSLPSGVVRDDCFSAWRTSLFDICLHSDTEVLSGRVYKNDRGMTTRPQRGNFAVIEHVRGYRLVVAVSHMPHGMAQDLQDKPYTSDVAKCYIADYKQLKRRTRELRREFNCDAELITCDFNIDIKRPWTRAWFDSNAPMYDVNWRKPYPRRGTLGNRIIDLTLYRGLVLQDRPQLLKKLEDVDHTPYSQRFKFVHTEQT